MKAIIILISGHEAEINEFQAVQLFILLFVGVIANTNIVWL